MTEPKQPDVTLREIVLMSAELLGQSERGRLVLWHLYSLLYNGASGLDSLNWLAVNNLLEAYRAGFNGTVLEAITKYREVF